MKRAAIITATLALTLTGCSTVDSESTATGTESQADFLAAHDLGGMEGAEMIDHLDQMPVSQRPTDLLASVRTDELVLSDNDDDVVVDLPENQTYVSIAPYVTQTHDCFYHSLTTCLGELGNENIQVTITDETTGEVLVDEETATFDNGFVGFWLPDEATGTIEITHEGRTGVTEFSTTDDGATCVTDLRLT
ncbi:CueP family metal-binding protein [Corynebacterium halotolerans]|uniref:CueP family metal-binding protein n=1 Tax=Corynebacterium halotolerans TaxID=225326 RepID=UPI003CEBC522